MKNIVFYNWNSLDSKRGGGVAVYQKNIIKELKKRSDIKIFYISSGVKYDRTKKVKIEKVENHLGIEEYIIINSPVLAPVKQSQENFKNYVEDENEFSKTFIEFVKSLGKIDIIHFNNLEGLTAKCLTIKKEIPNLKVIYSAHNYFPMCPQVNLWYQEKENCTNQDFENCNQCFKYQKRKKQIMENRINSKIKNPILNWILNKTNAVLRLGEKDKKYSTNYYQKFVQANTKALNENVDKILAVSKRVKEILVKAGIEENKIIISYIGNEFSDNKQNKCIGNSKANIFNIIYLGPMRQDKGFYFLKSAIKELPSNIKKNIKITFASKITDPKAVKELNQNKKDFNDIVLIDGYQRENLKEILADKNLGIVPILWEDNLPQVTIEMIASGVPVLTGDLGGAKELANNKEFTYQSGNIEDFCKKLINIYQNRNLLDEFYQKNIKLVTMKEHIEELEKIYEM